MSIFGMILGIPAIFIVAYMLKYGWNTAKGGLMPGSNSNSTGRFFPSSSSANRSTPQASNHLIDPNEAVEKNNLNSGNDESIPKHPINPIKQTATTMAGVALAGAMVATGVAGVPIELGVRAAGRVLKKPASFLANKVYKKAKDFDDEHSIGLQLKGARILASRVPTIAGDAITSIPLVKKSISGVKKLNAVKLKATSAVAKKMRKLKETTSFKMARRGLAIGANAILMGVGAPNIESQAANNQVNNTMNVDVSAPTEIQNNNVTEVNAGNPQINVEAPQLTVENQQQINVSLQEDPVWKQTRIDEIMQRQKDAGFDIKKATSSSAFTANNYLRASQDLLRNSEHLSKEDREFKQKVMLDLAVEAKKDGIDLNDQQMIDYTEEVYKQKQEKIQETRRLAEANAEEANKGAAKKVLNKMINEKNSYKEELNRYIQTTYLNQLPDLKKKDKDNMAKRLSKELIEKMATDLEQGHTSNEIERILAEKGKGLFNTELENEKRKNIIDEEAKLNNKAVVEEISRSPGLDLRTAEKRVEEKKYATYIDSVTTSIRRENQRTRAAITSSVDNQDGNVTPNNDNPIINPAQPQPKTPTSTVGAQSASSRRVTKPGASSRAPKPPRYGVIPPTNGRRRSSN